MARTWVHVEVKLVKRVTDRALLVVIDGKEVWLPKSTVAPADVDQYEAGDTDCSMSITDFIAHEKGLA